METRHLQTFAAAAELQSFTRAAKSLSLTQAAVSQHIAALEKELRVSLFDRSGRSVTPTESGRCLYEYVRKILDLMEAARHDVGHSTKSLAGTIEIAASTVPAETILPDLLQRFHEKYPEVIESVRISDSAEATRAVESGEAEVGFVGELPRAGGLKARTIASDELLLVISPEHPLAGRKQIGLRQFRSQPLIMREPGSGSRRCVEQTLEAAGLSRDDLNIVLETNSNDAIRRAVRRNMGAAFLSRALADDEIANGTLQSLAVRGVRPQRQLYLLSDPDRIPTAQVRAFLSFVHDWLETETST